MNLSVSLPLDSDGFLRRECPSCLRQFKWHHGPANEEAESHPDPEAYTCPLCGQPAGPNSWWTREQLDHVQGAAAPATQQLVQDELDQALRGLNSRFVKVKSTSSSDVPAGPMPLTEPDDMVIVTSPCHAYEPVKVPEDAPGPFRCLVCGAQFIV
jgi:hypothetical protein